MQGFGFKLPAMPGMPSIPGIMEQIGQAVENLRRMAVAIEATQAAVARLETRAAILDERMARIEMGGNAGDHWDETSGVAEEIAAVAAAAGISVDLVNRDPER